MDDPKLFGALSHVFPHAKLVQDGWHLEDRYSRAIPANNTLKGDLAWPPVVSLVGALNITTAS